MNDNWKVRDKNGLEWNKDMAFLMEVQRMENNSNNAAIMNEQNARYRCLVRWSSMIRPVFTKNQKEKLNQLKLRCISYESSLDGGTYENYNPSALDELQDFLNEMNVYHKLNLRESKGELDAVELD